MKETIAELNFFEPLAALEDHRVLVLNFTGGIRSLHTPEGWALEPVPVDGVPNLVGFLPSNTLSEFLLPSGIHPIFYEQTGVSNGVPFTFSVPWENKKPEAGKSAVDIWSAIGGRLPAERVQEAQFAKRIHLSLTSINVHLSRVVGLYRNQLVAAIHADKKAGARFSNGIDREIAASIHDFYAAVGTARDHLFGLIAFRLGLLSNKDDLARLLSAIKGIEDFEEAMIQFIVAKGHLVRDGKAWTPAGILAEIGSVRKRLIHNAPFGSFDDERWGKTEVVANAGDMEIRAYTRLFVMDDWRTRDVLDMMRAHYLFVVSLFRDMANASGYDKRMMVVSPEDIVSIKIDGKPLADTGNED